MIQIEEAGLQEITLYLTAPLFIFSLKGLNPTDKLTYIVIYGLARKKGVCFAGDAFIAEMIGKSPKTVAKSMKKLEDKKLIERETFFNPDTMKKKRKIRIKNSKALYIEVPMEILFYDIAPLSKILLMQIIGLSKKEGYAYATNNLLAQKINSSEASVKRGIAELKKQSFITTEQKGVTRFITVHIDNIQIEKEFYPENNWSKNIKEIRQEIQNIN